MEQCPGPRAHIRRHHGHVRPPRGASAPRLRCRFLRLFGPELRAERLNRIRAPPPRAKLCLATGPSRDAAKARLAFDWSQRVPRHELVHGRVSSAVDSALAEFAVGIADGARRHQRARA